MTHKELKQAISDMAIYTLVFTDHHRPAFEAILEAAEAHLETLPEPQPRWEVSVFNAEGHLVHAQSFATATHAAAQAEQFVRRGFACVSVARKEPT